VSLCAILVVREGIDWVIVSRRVGRRKIVRWIRTRSCMSDASLWIIRLSSCRSLLIWSPLVNSRVTCYSPQTGTSPHSTTLPNPNTPPQLLDIQTRPRLAYHRNRDLRDLPSRQRPPRRCLRPSPALRLPPRLRPRHVRDCVHRKRRRRRRCIRRAVYGCGRGCV
jgi:hypothetical protein